MLVAACGDEGGGPGEPLALEACGDGLECGSLEVPLDPAQAEGETIELALLRRPATDPARREGAILVNPGGPGASGIDIERDVIGQLSGAVPQLSARFDFVTWDPRGADRSGGIDCLDDDAVEEFVHLDPEPEDDSEWAEIDRASREFAAACEARSGPLLAHVDTETSARDMDRIRVALGDETISYLGFSYGTLLGATYATLFPERVRAFVLDAAVTPAPDLLAALRSQVGGYEAQLGRFLEDCGGDGACPFHGGTGSSSVGSAYDALAASLDETALPTGAPIDLGEAYFADAVSAFVQEGRWDELAAGLAAAEGGDGAALWTIVDPVTRLREDGTMPNATEAWFAIASLDAPCPEGFDLPAYRAWVGQSVAAAPRLGAWLASAAARCLGWSVRRPEAPTPIHAPTAPPLMVIGGLNDPAAPYELAGELTTLLDNDSHLRTWSGEGHVALGRSFCLFGAAMDFLADPSTPPPECE